MRGEGDAPQCLAPESERVHCVQISLEFTGRKAQWCERQVSRRNPRAIVSDH